MIRVCVVRLYLSCTVKVILEFKRSDGKITVNEQDRMTDIQTFSENLYSSILNVVVMVLQCNDFGHNLQFGKLSDEKKKIKNFNVDGEITLEECEKSFKMGNHQLMMDIQLSSTSNFSVS